MQTVAIAGASLAGLTAARALRNQGFDGRLVIIGDEYHRPYDRPPLSKEFLLGTITETDLLLEDEDESLDAEWILGTKAVSLDPDSLALTLDTGLRVHANGIILATGARARTLSGLTGFSNSFTLRTLTDARALAGEIVPGGRMLIIGAGFIGAEVASSARAAGMEVALVNSGGIPFRSAFGEHMGAFLGSLHESNGVELIRSTGIRDVEHDSGRITGITLADGRHLAADVVVVGIGSTPNTDWLAGSGLALGNGVLCDSMGRTSRDGIVAVGDCSAWFSELHEQQRRTEHWTDAAERPTLAVAAMLGRHPVVLERKAPYFWSDQYGVRIQFAGDCWDADRLEVVAGSEAEHNLLTVYYRGEEPVAVLGMNQARLFTRWRRAIRVPSPLALYTENGDQTTQLLAS